MPRKMKPMLFFICIMLLIVVAVYLVGTYLQASMTLKTTGTLYQYVAGEKMEFSGKTKLALIDDAVRINSDNYSGTMVKNPVYQLGTDKLYTLDTMEILRPSVSTAAQRLKGFSVITMRDGECFVNRSRKGITDGFLFDGDDIYIFLEPVCVTCHDKSINLGALSYAVVHYGQFIELYDYSTDSYWKLLLGNQSVATARAEKYSINLCYDILEIDGGQNLLFGKPELLSDYDG